MNTDGIRLIDIDTPGLRIVGRYVTVLQQSDLPQRRPVVSVNGNRLDPKASQKVWNHSPDGFAWGYNGSGPAQLALAILLRAGVPKDTAVRLHQQFKTQFIAPLPMGGDWSMIVDVLAWVAAHHD